MPILRRRRVLITIGIVIGTFLILAMLRLTSKRPANLGIQDGRLADCPNSPNCVCSQSNSNTHRIEPLQISEEHVDSSRELYVDELASVVRSLSRTTIVSKTGNYLHAETVSLLFRFVDDLELYVDWANKIVHFRSASRVGYGDLGVNRRRISRLKQQLIERGLAKATNTKA